MHLLCGHVYACGHTRAMAQEWRTEDNSWERSVLVFFHHAGLGNQTQVVRFDCKLLYLLSHPVGLSPPLHPHETSYEAQGGL